MKTSPKKPAGAQAGFTLVEVMMTTFIVVLAVSLSMSTFLFGLRMMYKDSQRLATNASLRTFMSQISNETLNASYYYLFPYYTYLDGNVDLTADPAARTQAYNNANDQYDQFIAHGDCLVLVTLTSVYRTTDIKQIRIYYRLTKDQSTTAGANLNEESPVYYYETPDTGGIPGNGWGEDDGTGAHLSNGHPFANLGTELNAINLKLNATTISGCKLLNLKSFGRLMPASTDRYPIFSTLSPVANPTTGCISINVEFVNKGNLQISSSSFNYTISPRK